MGRTERMTSVRDPLGAVPDFDVVNYIGGTFCLEGGCIGRTSERFGVVLDQIEEDVIVAIVSKCDLIF